MDNTKKSPDQAFEDSFDAMVEGLDERLEQVEVASKLLPAWFVPRMIDDVWHFGLMLTSGTVLGVSTIEAVTQDEGGNVWLDCRMLTADPGQASGINIMTAPIPERPRCSLNAGHVMAAFEIAAT